MSECWCDDLPNAKWCPVHHPEEHAKAYPSERDPVSAQGQTGPTRQDEAGAAFAAESRRWTLQMLISDAMQVSWSDEDEYANAAIDITAAVLAAGYLSAAEVERQITAARAQALRDAAETQRWMVSTYRDQELPGLTQRRQFADWLDDEADRIARADAEGNR